MRQGHLLLAPQEGPASPRAVFVPSPRIPTPPAPSPAQARPARHSGLPSQPLLEACWNSRASALAVVGAAAPLSAAVPRVPGPHGRQEPAQPPPARPEGSTGAGQTPPTLTHEGGTEDAAPEARQAPGKALRAHLHRRPPQPSPARPARRACVPCPPRGAGPAAERDGKGSDTAASSGTAETEL